MISYGDVFKSNKGKGTKLLPPRCSEIVTKEIPSKLKELFPEENFTTQGSVGIGRTTETPWVSILDKREVSSTQHGVYLVMLFSGDLNKAYFCLAQGVTKTKKNDIAVKRDEIRKLLNLENDILKHVNDLDIEKEVYKNSAIYSCTWNCNDPNYCERILREYKDAIIKYVQIKHGVETEQPKISSTMQKNTSTPSSKSKPFSIREIIDLINSTGLIYPPSLIKRFAFSLLSKPFVILSGLAGSGKTQLALAFASALVEDREKQMRVVSVGADWTNREPLLGYPNALDKTEYVRPENGVLDLLIEANKPENSSKPFFLILDEMNMSYVERYFADFLSVMESHEEMPLWNGYDETKDKTPKSVALPENLFIIGTINVDETTYMSKILHWIRMLLIL